MRLRALALAAAVLSLAANAQPGAGAPGPAPASASASGSAAGSASGSAPASGSASASGSAPASASGSEPPAAPPSTQKPAASRAKAPAKKPPAGAKIPIPPPPPPLCSGDYADTLPAEVAAKVADSPQPWVVAIRNVSTYENVYYGKDGKLRRAYLRAVAHGSGFAYRQVNGETYIVTNEHVASRPEVTDEEHTVEGVPFGSKKVREQLKIVRDDSDDYEPGHLPLSKVLSDPPTDTAVLKAKLLLPVMPWRLGRSGALRAGNLVQVRGFPLGVFRTLSQGKVINPYVEDSDKGWAHSDFVIDALLSSGNSGSPVFAISCRTGEPELVGIYHAGYNEAAALNVVVGIDQLKEELETLRVPKRDSRAGREVTAADRDKVLEELRQRPARALIFPYGGRAVRVSLEAREEAELLRFAVLDEEYPLSLRETTALVDRAENGLGTLDLAVLPAEQQEVEVPVAALDGDAREHFERLNDALWVQLLAVIDYRARIAKGRLSAEAFADAQALKARIKKRAPEQKELLGLVAFDADRAGAAGRVAGAAAPEGPAGSLTVSVPAVPAAGVPAASPAAPAAAAPASAAPSASPVGSGPAAAPVAVPAAAPAAAPVQPAAAPPSAKAPPPGAPARRADE